MTYASTPTLLSLDRYARILGINPAHFSGATVLNPPLFPYGANCSDRWFQHAWQSHNYVAREDLARAIGQVEEELARFLGYYPAPVWIEHEPHLYPRDYDPAVWGSDRDVRFYDKSVALNYGRFIQAGKRTCTRIATVVPVFTDVDGDTFNETVTISTATAVTEISELKVYFHDHTEPEWEIRPVRTKVLSGGTVTFTFYTWQFIDPVQHEKFPPGPMEEDQLVPIDLSDESNIVDEVDVCREYTDSSQHSAAFYWEPLSGTSCPCCGGTGCPACTHYEQDGCLYVRNVEQGIVAVSPAEYENSAWVNDDWDMCRPPDIVKTHYYAGDLDNLYLRGVTHDPLSDFWAIIIAQMATARLEKPFCACGNLTDVQDELRKDLTYTTQGESRYVTKYVLECPFGTRRGEVNAWMKLSKIIKKRGKVALI